MSLAASTSEISIRLAKYSDLSAIAQVWYNAFFDDPIIGDLLHPNRHSHPQDVLRWFQHGVRERFWDWEHRFVVATITPLAPNDTNSKERIVGAANWRRLGDRMHKIKSGMALPVQDIRAFIAPVMRAYHELGWRVWPNRATTQDPAKAAFLEHAVESGETLFEGKRSECWDLHVLGVDPEWQGKGVGKELVRWGLDKAMEERCSASVMTGWKQEPFYKKAGFQETMSNGDGGIVLFWDPPESDSEDD